MKEKIMLKIDSLVSSGWFDKMFKNPLIMALLFFIFIYGIAHLFYAGFLGILLKVYLVEGIIFTILAVLYSLLFILWSALAGYKLEKGLEKICLSHPEWKIEDEGFYQIRVLWLGVYLYMVFNK